jgi:carbamate kinase
VVPSPDPIEIVELEVIRDLVERNVIVIACGGGGIPVIWKNGALEGVEAVIDKDRASALLAAQLEVDLFVISTDADFVYLNYKRANQRPLRTVCASELHEYLQAGQFPPGNMGPKIESVLRFLANGGEEAIITSCDQLGEAVRGSAGTHIFPDRESMKLALDLRLELPVGGR